MRSFPAASLMRSLCAAACWVLLALQSEASDPNKPLTEYTHTVWTHKDGIPSAFIYSIAQTRDGYLWLATTDGLVRFDGVRFVHWRPKTGRNFWVWCGVCAQRGMEVSGSGLRLVWSATFVGKT
jgi:ligand-binding sensor domain-containing protein